MWRPILALIICITVDPTEMKPGITIGRLNFECYIKDSYQCVNGNCVLKEKHCDGVEDCADGSDELECDKYHCTPPNWYRCKEGTCISVVYKCDGENECIDGSDEVDCEGYDDNRRTNVTCTSDEWKCNNTDCIPKDFVCNGQKDCKDESDEVFGCAIRYPCPGFVCKEGRCIDKSWICDGAQDCDDNDDEKNCDDRPVSFMCVLEHDHYPCRDNSSCIPLSKVCDNINHCKDGSDEGEACSASVNKCQITKCGHENSTCAVTPAGAKCICPKGYQNVMHSSSDIYSIYNNQQRCVDVDECATIYGLCSHVCINTPGSYKCECDRHYLLQPDGSSCKTVNSDPELLFSTESEIRSLLLKSRVLKPVVERAELVVGVGHDDHYIYWTELYEQSESLMRAKEGGEHEILVRSGILTPEDLEVDWYTNNIYFTDSELSHVAVCTNDGDHCTVLINSDIEKPRGIALYPAKGLMYWSDWGKYSKIGSSFMDGSTPKALVAEHLGWPNGIALDVSNDRIYWVDARMSNVESVKLDGSDRRIVLEGGSKHPFSIAIFEDNIYWSDWKSKSIQTCHKFNCKNRTTVIKVDKRLIYGIHIRHSALQPKFKNPCENSKCTHICLLKGVDNHACACPEGRELSSNKYECRVTNGKPELVLGAGSLFIALSHQILGKHNTAGIPLELTISEMVYDSKKGRIFMADNIQRKIFAFDPKDVMTGSRNLSVIVPSTETVEAMDFDPFGNNLYWVDSTSKSIEVFNLGVKEHALLLHDLEDETPIGLALVPAKGVMFIVFRATNHTYIDRMRMDGKGERTTIISRGLSITGIIRLAFDVKSHRIFWTDQESGNMESTSVEGDDRQLFRKLLNLPIGLAILQHNIYWTSKHSSTVHWVDTHHPKTNFKKTISLDPLNYIRPDYPDSLLHLEGFENLRIAAVTGVYHYIHPCQESNGNCSHICVPLSYKTTSCLCPPGLTLLRPEYLRCIVNIRCNVNQFRCYTSNSCIPIALRCNGISNCAGAEDEIDCDDFNHGPTKCESFQFQCNDGSCIEKNLQCDSNYNCPDHSDEQDCSNQTVFTNCEKSQFECKDGHCIDERSRCDNFSDCLDGSDEKLCEMVQCRPNMFQCQSGSCIPKAWECDREIDCIDGSDEHFSCGYKHNECDPTQFACTNRLCINSKLKCNMHDDCGDNSDEINCSNVPGTTTYQKEKESNLGICDSDKFLCEESLNQSCLPVEVRCNGTEECYNGEDERNCNKCRFDEFMCKNKKCISEKWLCDGTNDCGDKSDESVKLCSKNYEKYNMTFPLPGTAPLCDDGYACKNKECVDIDLVCNNKEDCSDGSDEGFSCSMPCSTVHCEQECRATPEGPKCFCKKGYKRAGNKMNCMDIDECMIQPSVCSHKCTNFRGSFICSCYEGYVLRANKRSCKAIGNLKSIYYASESSILEMKLLPPSLNVVYSEWGPDISGMDILMSNNTLYFAFQQTGQIYSQNLITHERNYISDIGKPINIAIDWIRQNIYFVDNQQNDKTIKVCRLGTIKCVAVTKLESNSEVKSLVVDPINKVIFYAIFYWNIDNKRPLTNESHECSSDRPCPTSIIFKAKLDGSDRTQLISKNVKEISGLSVDYFKKLLYFCDLRKETLEVVDYSAKDRQVVIDNHPLLKAPHKLIIFEDNAYMLRSKSSKMIKCKLFESRECYNFELFNPHCKWLTIDQSSTQLLQKNVCENNNCSTVCVPASKGYTCLCNDGKDCTDSVVLSSITVPDFTHAHSVLMILIGLCVLLILSCFVYYIRWRHLRTALYWIIAPLTCCYIWLRTQQRMRNQPVYDPPIVEYHDILHRDDDVVFNFGELQQRQDGQVVQGEQIEGDLIDLVNRNFE